ncbi:serine/threonine protein kinase ppk15, putative [Entamoeba histolytica KU27]|uniref:Serine/threonine protein kinase ppk15, putative n=1 Tax=Entamoeba histolytica KU27 TaxID=885311 RepID=M2RRE0_ENTHI|nr:serine/threonine protein kinase ppk15, putative [Entamoeba histolytica KU27]
MKQSSCFCSFIPNKNCVYDIIGRGSIHLTKEVTSRIVNTMRRCNSNFQTESILQPTLTKPETPISNGGLDNENQELIIRKGDIIGSYNSIEGRRYSMRKSVVTQYKIIEKLGQGTFGQVFKCQDLNNGKMVALKILKNKKAYFRQGLLEVTTLTIVNTIYDKGCSHIVEMIDHFLYCGHLCIVQELLGQNLYQMLKEVRLRGMKLSNIKKITRQILEGMSSLNEAGIVHCDLKPENVLINNKDIKIIDLGSACFSNYTLYSYIQSRHYRAPEIALGMKYSTSIDMWSVGCIVAEMFLGIPLFPANSEYDLLYRFVQTLGMLPFSLLSTGNKSKCYFKKSTSSLGVIQYRLKEQFEYEWENNCDLPPHKEYLPVKLLKDIIFKCQLRVESPLTLKTKQTLFDFLSGCFQYDPKLRFTPKQALAHPFITNGSLKDFVLPPREFPYKVYGHVVTAEPSQMIADTYKDISITNLDLSRSQYYDVYMTLLRAGHVANITIDSPFRYGSITPPQLSQVFKKGIFDNLPLYNSQITPREISTNEFKTLKSLYPSRLSSSELVLIDQGAIDTKGSITKLKSSSSLKEENTKRFSGFKKIEVNKHENALREEKSKKKLLSKELRIDKERRNKSYLHISQSNNNSDNLITIPIPLKKVSLSTELSCDSLNTTLDVPKSSDIMNSQQQSKLSSANTISVPKLSPTDSPQDNNNLKKRRFSWSDGHSFNFSFFKKKKKCSSKSSEECDKSDKTRKEKEGQITNKK